MSHQSHEQAAAGLIVRFAILTLSDTRTKDTDTSGQEIEQLVRAAGHCVVARDLIPDDAHALQAAVKPWLDDVGIDAIVTTGGTGISRRDDTVPTIESLIDSPLPGFGELFRALSYQQIGAAAMLSRAVAGVASRKFIAALPGSTHAVSLAMRELILPQIRHIVGELRK